MSYCSHVAAAIGGDSKKIHQFVKKIKSDSNLIGELQIISDFRIVELELNFSIFVYYNDYIKWYEEEEMAWKNLCDLANQFNLSYIFYRLGVDPSDFEIESNSEQSYFDSQLEELFSFYHCIEINTIKLCSSLK